ncbi:hypothetical protein K501DRAFT_278799 [Backusella circina FSU 941]|nr:hypothetical protein K501DRAFT_278799 [Backusella circina FSU 941]
MLISTMLLASDDVTLVQHLEIIEQSHTATLFFHNNDGMSMILTSGKSYLVCNLGREISNFTLFESVTKDDGAQALDIFKTEDGQNVESITSFGSIIASMEEIISGKNINAVNITTSRSTSYLVSKIEKQLEQYRIAKITKTIEEHSVAMDVKQVISNPLSTNVYLKPVKAINFLVENGFFWSDDE